MITVTGDAKITMGGQDVADIVTDKDTVSIEGLGCRIEVCEHEASDERKPVFVEEAGAHIETKCIKCGEFYR